MPHRITNPIATRHYGVQGEPGREVILTIGKPRPRRRGDWSCSVLIEGIPGKRPRRIRGVDPIQALQQAMRYARHELDASGLPITWLDQEPGDIGLPLPINSPFGLWFQRRLERLVEKEIERVGKIVIELRKAQERRGPKSKSG